MAQVRMSMCFTKEKATPEELFLMEWCRSTKNYTKIIAGLVFAHENGGDVTQVTHGNTPRKAEKSPENEEKLVFDEDIFASMFG